MIEGHGDDMYKYSGIRMNFSSNVYGATDLSGLFAHLGQRMEAIRTYPEPAPHALDLALADYLHLTDPRCVCVTNGATEAIYLVAQTYRGCASAILTPTFSEYADACRLHEHRVKFIYTLDSLPSDTRLVWLCNPNNPTGETRDKEVLCRCILSHPQCLFVIDQSYESFTLKPVLGVAEAAALPNVILIHSMTKRFSVPGLRLGYLTASPRLLEALRLQRMPWSVNALAIEAGFYLLAQAESLQPDLIQLIAEKDRLAQALQATGAVEVWPSDTHFMLLRLRNGRASALKEWLAKERGILIRDASNFAGLDGSFFRIATQTPAENDELIEAISHFATAI